MLDDRLTYTEAGELVTSLGTSGFPGSMWSWLRRSIDPDCYHSVALRYRRAAGSRHIENVDVIFHAGNLDPATTRLALELYADKGEWKSDSLRPHIERVIEPQLVNITSLPLASSEYTQLIDKAMLGESCTLLGCDPFHVYEFSIFRHRHACRYSLAELSRLRRMCDFLMPMLIQHSRLAAPASAQAAAPIQQKFERKLISHAIALSKRERDVCIAILQNQSIADIASHMALGQCSIRTYLNRALEKIGVCGKSALFAWSVADN
ncbi:LuxR C-terminal-related transcriptional regulator [Vogesella sp. LIG4]|uniref:helix-turn-helix transcriptional regulator n=1 Tax=Vogesella sp. LIG4 TaxID=1192162 RepID=UPI00081F9385|nr:LuxR C-terminal-related transcriptional regulator [Vogesella sp. LIG4]SCK21104.1 Response regulator containing a CheY-like receiver domain and an HTH DNA-binding domain [Vogesella sp. LIG4]